MNFEVGNPKKKSSVIVHNNFISHASEFKKPFCPWEKPLLILAFYLVQELHPLLDSEGLATLGDTVARLRFKPPLDAMLGLLGTCRGTCGRLNLLELNYRFLELRQKVLQGMFSR